MPLETATIVDPAAVAGVSQWVILCVDDEPNILSALKRLLRAEGYLVHTAPGGTQALALLETEPVDLVISDMRMPGMDGAAFLEQVRKRSPEIVRLLLTGYADIDSTVRAINTGEIARYIAKPWDGAEMLLIVRQALERKALEAENRHLQGLTRRQNMELLELNATLETRVQERTAALARAHTVLQESNAKLTRNFLTSIEVFSNVVALREPAHAGRLRRTADMARELGLALALSGRALEDVFVAALLHGIGNIAGGQLGRDMSHIDPSRGQQVLLPIQELENVGWIIRSHCERYDGTGFPDGLRGDKIPIGARILAVARAYVEASFDNPGDGCVSPDDAAKTIMKERGSRFDPRVCDMLAAMQTAVPATPGAPGQRANRA